MEAEQRGGRARRAAPQCVPRPRLRPSAARRSAYSQYSAVDAFIGAGISHTPEKILDAPDLLDDYYLNLLDWSSACVSSLRSCLSAPSAPAAPCRCTIGVAHSLEMAALACATAATCSPSRSARPCISGTRPPTTSSCSCACPPRASPPRPGTRGACRGRFLITEICRFPRRVEPRCEASWWN